MQNNRNQKPNNFQHKSWRIAPLFAAAIVLFYAEKARAVIVRPLLAFAKKMGFASYGSFQEVFGAAISVLLSMSAILAVISMAVSGYQFIISQGNEKKLIIARSNLFWSIVGFTVVVCAWVLVVTVTNAVKSGIPG